MANPDNDDDKWLDALSQGARAGAPPGTPGETEILRRIIHDSEAEDQRNVQRTAHDDEQALQSLLFRLRRERLLAQPRRYLIPAALAASVLLVALFLAPQWLREEAPVYDEPPRPRGAIETREIASAQPKADAERLATALKGAGVGARVYQEGKRFVVDFSLGADDLEKASETLKQFGVAGRQGDNRVVVRPRGGT